MHARCPGGAYPDEDIALDVVELEAHGAEHLLEAVEVGLLCLRIGVPVVPVVLIVDGRAGEHLEATGAEDVVDVEEVEAVELGPGDEAARALRHVKGCRQEG